MHRPLVQVGSHVLAPTEKLDSRWPCINTVIKKMARDMGVIITGERNLQQEDSLHDVETPFSVV